ncbi:hypothetical protein [Desulfurobacterium sp.]
MTSYEELAEQDIFYDPATGEVFEEKKTVNGNQNGNGKVATERQLNAVKTIAEKRKLSEEQLQELIKSVTGKGSLEELNRDEILTLISTFNKLASKQLLIEIQNLLKELGIKNDDKKKLYQEVIGKSTSKYFQAVHYRRS